MPTSTCLVVVVLLLGPTTADPVANSSENEAASRPAAQRESAELTTLSWVLEEARRILDAQMLQKVTLADRVCGLSDSQFEKLRLASRGDNQRLLDRIEQIAAKVKSANGDEDKMRSLADEASQFRRSIGDTASGPRLAGPVDENSLFHKFLETMLTPEQSARYRPLRVVLYAGGQIRINNRVEWDEGFEIDLRRTAFSDDDLAQVSRLPGIVSLILSGTRVTDAGLMHLKELVRLRRLWLDDTAVSDAGLAHLKAIPNLKTLLVANTRVTNAGLAHLRAMPALEQITLDGTAVTGDGLAQLKELSTLRVLMLCNTTLTDDGLAQLSKLSALTSIGLDGTPVTDAGLGHLQKLPRLHSIWLRRTRITDAGVAQLLRLNTLRMLWLDGTEVTDNGVAQMKAFTHLQQISLKQTRVTDAGIADLRSSLPRLRIEK